MPTLPLRVQQSTSTTGTGTIVLNAAVAGRRSYQDAYGTSTVRVAYVISGASFFEIGYGDFDGGSPGTLTRATVISSSNSDSLVSLPVGTADVFPVIDSGERPLVVSSGAITLALEDIGNAVVWTGSSAASITLPAVAGVPNGRGWLIRNLGTATLTIDPDASETIDGATTLAVPAGNSVEILRAGTQWVSFGNVASALATPPPIGGTTPAAGAFTTLSASGAASFDDALTVAGTTTLGDAVSITDGGLTVADGVTITGDVDVTGNLSVSQSAAVPAVLTLHAASGSGRIWQMVSATNGVLAIADATAGANRFTVDSAGNCQIAEELTVSGSLWAPTAAPGTNTTQVATTAFVAAAVAGLPGFAHGSNGNGNYMTIGSGTLQICRFRLVMPGGSTSWSWTYPLSFSATPQIFVFPEAAATGTVSLTAVSATAVTGNVSGTPGTLSMLAIL
jgi:hypothetical protein